jgi:hypothetical protein
MPKDAGLEVVGDRLNLRGTGCVEYKVFKE